MQHGDLLLLRLKSDLHKMASRKSGKAGINWMSKKKSHSTFQRLELSDVIDKVLNTLIHDKRKISRRQEQ